MSASRPDQPSPVTPTAHAGIEAYSPEVEVQAHALAKMPTPSATDRAALWDAIQRSATELTSTLDALITGAKTAAR